MAAVSLTWNDLDDAENVAELFRDAALDSKGQIRDHGYWQDHLSLLAQIEEARNS